MEKYLILGGTFSNCSRQYRGTYRISPSYVDDCPPDSPVNKYFQWFLQEGGERGIVSDRDQALNLVTEYGRLTPPQYFDVVRVIEDRCDIVSGDQFLGFDICSNLYYSPLAWEFLLNGDADFPAKPLMQLLKTHFSPMLGKSGLFIDQVEATFCLRCILTLCSAWPNLFEGDNNRRFEVVGLSVVNRE